MLKWVVTKRAAPTAPRVPPINDSSSFPIVTQPECSCSCDKENHCEETIEFESNNNNSYAFNDLGNYYSPRKCRLSSGPLNRTADSRGTTGCSCRLDPTTFQNRPRIGQTPLSSRNQLRKKLRTRRERNKTLAMRLSAASLNASLSEHATVVGGHTPLLKSEKASVDDLFNLYREPPTAKAELLQTFLNSNPGPFQEREVKTPEGPSPLADGAGQLIRQRAVRRKQPPQQQQQQHPHCKLVKMEMGQRRMETNDSPSAFYSAYIFRELAREMLV